MLPLYQWQYNKYYMTRAASFSPETGYAKLVK